VEVGILDLADAAGMRIARHDQAGGPLARVAEALDGGAIEAAVDLVLEEVGDEELLLVLELA